MLRSLKPRILCVDDELSAGEIIRAIFEEAGDFIVETESNSNWAVTRAKRFNPDLIILDIRMPDQDGCLVAQQIRDEPGLRHRPIIFFSGVPERKEAALKAARGGPTAFGEKGVPFQTLEEEVRRNVSERLGLYLAEKSVAEKLRALRS